MNIITVQQLKSDLKKLANPENAINLARFFKTGPGQYGEGDIFLGITSPQQRLLANKYAKIINFRDLEPLIRSKIHEERLTSLLILDKQYSQAKKDPEKQAKIAEFYLENLDWVNNWDLVDVTCPKLLGAHFYTRNRDYLYELAKSGHLWRQRVAIMTTFYFIREKDFQDSLAIAKILLHHPHDLIHKAVGWMLREIGNRDKKVELAFLDQYYREMPRTMLRYAIEKFPEEERQRYLKKD